jgi:hypothetical protein
VGTEVATWDVEKNMGYESRICSACIQDKYLKGQIQELIGVPAECDYCGESGLTITMLELAQRCDHVIENFFEVSSLTPAVVHHNRTPHGEDISTLLSRLLALSEHALDDLQEILDDLWLDSNIQESKYGEDPWFVDSSGADGQISYEWEKMELSLRDTTRLFNPVAQSMLEKVFGPVIHDRTYEGQPVITQAGIGHRIESLFRAREFETLKDLEQALEHPEASLGPPPAGKGTAGRMNCAGIPVFYGATEPATALAEVRPAVGAHVTVAKFDLVRELNLLDLKGLESISLESSSKFDPVTADRNIRKNFLKTLISRLTMPVLPSMANNDYLITQAIADFLATHPKLSLDGILFPSTQNKKNDPDARNVVLFRKASGVLKSSLEYRHTAIAYLYEYEDDEAWFAPQIETEPIDVSVQGISWPTDQERFQPSLKLNRDSIWIHTVEAIHYTTNEILVRHTNKCDNSSGHS